MKQYQSSNGKYQWNVEDLVPRTPSQIRVGDACTMYLGTGLWTVANIERINNNWWAITNDKGVTLRFERRNKIFRFEDQAI